MCAHAVGRSLVLCREASYSSIYNIKFSFYSQLINNSTFFNFQAFSSTTDFTKHSVTIQECNAHLCVSNTLHYTQSVLPKHLNKIKVQLNFGQTESVYNKGSSYITEVCLHSLRLTNHLLHSTGSNHPSEQY